MWDWTGHMGTWWWVMTPLMVMSWALLVWGIVALVQRNRITTTRTPDAERLLADRLARGEIDELTYRRRRALIRS